MKCQATTYSHNLCLIFTDIARVLMYSFRDQLQPVLTGFLQFFAVPVRGFCILKLSGTGPVRSPSKKDNRTETGPDFKALIFGITSQDCLAKLMRTTRFGEIRMLSERISL